MKISEDQVTQSAELLHDYATHFVQSDWNYTRNHGIKTLYENTFSDRFKDIFKYSSRNLHKKITRKKPTLNETFHVSWWRMVKAHWRYHNHLPDGILDGGNVITHWEETGEYLQMVQPSVGTMLADWMKAEPDNPYAQQIAAELLRISQGYAARVEQESRNSDLDETDEETELV